MLPGEQQIFNLIFWNAIHYIIWIQKGKELEDYYLFIHATGVVVLPVLRPPSCDRLPQSPSLTRGSLFFCNLHATGAVVLPVTTFVSYAEKAE